MIHFLVFIMRKQYWICIDVFIQSVKFKYTQNTIEKKNEIAL